MSMVRTTYSIFSLHSGHFFVVFLSAQVEQRLMCLQGKTTLFAVSFFLHRVQNEKFSLKTLVTTKEFSSPM